MKLDEDLRMIKLEELTVSEKAVTEIFSHFRLNWDGTLKKSFYNKRLLKKCRVLLNDRNPIAWYCRLIYDNPGHGLELDDMKILFRNYIPLEEKEVKPFL